MKGLFVVGFIMLKFEILVVVLLLMRSVKVWFIVVFWKNVMVLIVGIGCDFVGNVGFG